jgi:hypothetical protein
LTRPLSVLNWVCKFFTSNNLPIFACVPYPFIFFTLNTLV